MSAVESQVPSVAFRISDPEFREHGYDILERVRDAGPVVFSPEHENTNHRGDAYLLTHHRSAARMLGDARHYRQPPELFETFFGDVVFEGIDDRGRHDEI